MSGDEQYVVVDTCGRRIEVHGPYANYEDARAVSNMFDKATTHICILDWIDPDECMPPSPPQHATPPPTTTTTAVYCTCDIDTQKAAGHWERAGRWVCNECGREKPF